MAFSTYEEIHKDKVEYAIRDRYRAEIQRLTTLGFREEFYLREMGYPFSALLRWDILLGFYQGNEVFRIGGLLQLMAFNAFLIHEDGYTYAVPFHLGVRYVTAFDDGTMLNTSSYENGDTHLTKYRYVCQVCITGVMDDVWHMHEQRVASLSEGRSVRAPLCIEDVMDIEARTDWEHRSNKVARTTRKKKSKI